MSPKIVVADESVREQREALVDKVLAQFAMPPRADRLLIFLDNDDWKYLKDEIGKENRGVYTRLPLSKEAEPPAYLSFCLERRREPAVEDLIYVHGSTCAGCDVGLSMTLAHEVQHFVQYSTAQRCWAASNVLRALGKEFLGQYQIAYYAVPHEREARIVSKRVATAIFGAQEVACHIDSQIAKATSPCDEDGKDWESVKGIQPGHGYDLCRETRQVFRSLDATALRVREKVADALCKCIRNNQEAFATLNIDMLLSGRF